MSVITHPPPAVKPDDDPLVVALQCPTVRADLTAQSMSRLNRWLRDQPKLRREQEAELIVIDTINRAWEKRATFDRTRNIGAWLHGILRNVLAEACRKLRKLPVQPAVPFEEFEDDADPFTEPGKLTEMLNRLSRDDRNLVVWACIEDLGHKEIGDRLNIRAATSRQRLRRLLAEMRNEYTALLREGNR